jgi:hypothetical protein
MIRTIIAICLAYWLISNLSANSKPTPYDYSYYKEMSYQELYDFPNDCGQADKQLSILRRLQESKHFDSDPDKLSPADRDYNGRLKATIWWFAYRCDKS